MMRRHVDLYKLNTGVWEDISHVSLSYLFHATTPQAYVNEASHWLLSNGMKYHIRVQRLSLRVRLISRVSQREVICAVSRMPGPSWFGSSGLNELEIDNDFIKPMDTRKNGEILWMANHSLRLLVSVDDVVEKAKDVDLGKSTIHVMLIFTKRSLFYLINRKVIVLEMLVRSHPVYVKESPKLGDKGSYEQKLKVECENCLCFAHEWIAIRVKNEREMVAEEWKEEYACQKAFIVQLVRYVALDLMLMGLF
ncbi:hypothetical protein FXO38_03773 [Capsicum annuum]|nr:hypothetical protein FXO38_03773 [Capsicum annuum]KAF3679884.1 hypothetical protein FXO37_03613 [Capsicum annuum]